VDDGKTAILHESGDLEGFAASIRTLAEQPELAARMSQNAAAWAREFSSETMAERVESVYLKEIQARRDLWRIGEGFSIPKD